MKDKYLMSDYKTMPLDQLGPCIQKDLQTISARLHAHVAVMDDSDDHGRSLLSGASAAVSAAAGKINRHFMKLLLDQRL
jgi:hypothetical protein